MHSHDVLAREVFACVAAALLGHHDVWPFARQVVLRAAWRHVGRPRPLCRPARRPRAPLPASFPCARGCLGAVKVQAHCMRVEGGRLTAGTRGTRALCPANSESFTAQRLSDVGAFSVVVHITPGSNAEFALQVRSRADSPPSSILNGGTKASTPSRSRRATYPSRASPSSRAARATSSSGSTMSARPASRRSGPRRSWALLVRPTVPARVAC